MAMASRWASLAAKASSSAKTSLDHEEETDPSNSGNDVEVSDDIFLSHSGKEKPFVEHLYNALRSANHTAFFDRYSLPKALPFPPNIQRAVRGCKLGVVVLSDDFLTSKWPMLELEMLVRQSTRVLPVFYKLRPEDLNSPTNLSKWRPVWEKKADQQQQAEQWERAVKELRPNNGLVFVQGMSEPAYIEEVVNCICDLVPCHALYDLSSIQGHQHLDKEIERQFEYVDNARHISCKKACMVGLHGVGGLGKTTLCKSMVNFYTSPYLGRSCLVEFPTDGNKLTIVAECKRALKKLANLSNDRILNDVHSVDQVVHLMREHVGRYDVFLAIDNVWENSREEAERLLGVGFSAASKILLTSRSEQILHDLLVDQYTNNSHIGPLPAPQREGAIQIFQENVKLKLGDLVDRNQIDSILERCKFSGNYHPLALKALGQHVKKVCSREDLERNKHHLSFILEEVSNADLQKLEDVIKLNYESLPQHTKRMFVDIAVWVPQEEYRFSYKRTHAAALQWLLFFYKEFSKIKITSLIHELALNGLIQIEKDEAGEKMIRVHDLFVDLAQREAARSHDRLCFPGLSTKPVEGMEWKGLERVILCGVEGSHFIEKLQQQECPKLQLLYAAQIKIRSRIHLESMPSLCVLILLIANPIVPSLEGVDASRIINLNGLVQLEFLWLSGCTFVKRFTGLNALQNLQMLHIEKCPCLENLDGLSCLIRLEALHVESCHSLKKMPDLGGLIGLEMLRLSYNFSMEEVGCLSSALKEVSVGYCEALKKMPDLGGLTGLERLRLSYNYSMEEVGCLSSALKEVRVVWCGSLKKMPDLGGLTGLERLELWGNESMEEVGCLSSALKEIIIGDFGALKKMPDLGGLTGLERLELRYNGLMEEVGCLSSALKEVRVEGCGALKEMPDLGGLTGLEHLRMEGCGRVRKVDVGGLTNLKRLHVRGCKALEEMGDMSALLSLKERDIKDCPRLKNVET